MKLNYLFIILLVFAVGCSKEEPFSKPISASYTAASDFLPLALDNEWTYLKTDSTDPTFIDSSEIVEKVDSCCYYIGRYTKSDMKFLGWKWRSSSGRDMYANGNNRLFTTSHIEKEKGSWHNLDSSIFSGNLSIVHIASGKYSVNTKAGTFNCIKARLSLTNYDQNTKSIYYRYYGEKVGLVKERIEIWSGLGSNASIVKTYSQELISYSLK